MQRLKPPLLARAWGVACAAVAVVFWLLLLGGRGPAWYFAVEWTIGAVVLLAVTPARMEQGGFRIPRGVVGHREIRYADVDHIELPHPLSTSANATIVLASGERVTVKGLRAQTLERAACEHDLPVVVGHAVRRLPLPAPSDKPMDVTREAELIRQRDRELRYQLEQIRSTRTHLAQTEQRITCSTSQSRPFTPKPGVDHEVSLPDPPRAKYRYLRSGVAARSHTARSPVSSVPASRLGRPTVVLPSTHSEVSPPRLGNDTH